MTSEMTDEEIPEHDGTVEVDDPVERALEARKQRSLSARRSAQAMERAAQGWLLVKDDEDFLAIAEQAEENYDNGDFLLQQLGGEAGIDPSTTATLLILRRRLKADLQVTMAHEEMLIDLVIIDYFNSLRIQRWSNDLAYDIEHELFGTDAPRVTYRYRQQLADRLTVEEHLTRLREQLLPMFDRTSRSCARLLTTIKALRSTPAPAVAVGQAGQVNIAAMQANTASSR